VARQTGILLELEEPWHRLGEGVVRTAELDDGSGRGLLVYQGGTLRALAGGVGAMSVDDVTLTDDAVWVAGSIAQAGPPEARVSSIGVARYAAAGR
jgi:hypothetical protein